MFAMEILGAPGSVPLRGLVRKYASVNPDLDSNQNSKLIGSLMSQPGKRPTTLVLTRFLSNSGVLNHFK